MPVKKRTTKKLSPNKEKILMLKQQAAYYEKKAIQYSRELQQLQDHLLQVEEREKEQQKQLESLNQTFTRQQERETEWNDKLASFSMQIRDLETQLAQQAKLLAQRENTISHYKKKWKSSPFKQKAEQYEQQLQRQLKLNARSLKEMDALNLKLEQVMNQLNTAKEQEAKLTDQIHQQISVIESYQAKEKEWLQTVTELRQSHQELQQQLQQVIATHEQVVNLQETSTAEKTRLLDQPLSEVSSSHTEEQTGCTKQLEE